MAEALTGMRLTTPLPRDRAVATVVSVGTAVQDLDAPGLLVTRERWHSWQFMLTLRGAGEVEMDGRWIAIPTLSATLLPRDRAHRYRRQAGSRRWEYRWVEFDGEQVPALLAMFGLGDAWSIPGCGEILPHVERIHDLLCGSDDSEGIAHADTHRSGADRPVVIGDRDPIDDRDSVVSHRVTEQ
jgi:hypothetical protein